MIAHKNFQVSHQNDRSFWFAKSKLSDVQQKSTSHQNDRTENFSHQNDRLTVTRHTLIIITIHNRKPCPRRLAGYVGVSNELNTVIFQFKREHSSETKLISVPLRLPAGRCSKRPTVPDFPDIEFVQARANEHQFSPVRVR